MVAQLKRRSGKRSSHRWTQKIGGHRNSKKHKEINNGEQYIALEISLELGGIDRR